MKCYYVFIIFMILPSVLQAQKEIDKINDKKLPDKFLEEIATLKKEDVGAEKFFSYRDSSSGFIKDIEVNYNVHNDGTIQGAYIFKKSKMDCIDNNCLIRQDKFKINLSKVIVKCKTHSGKHECGLLDEKCQDEFEKKYKCSGWYPE